MKTILSLSLDQNVAVAFKEYCEGLNTSVSKVGAKIITDYLNEHSVQMVKCSTCGAVYSEKVKACPLCAIEGAKVQEVKSKLEEVNTKIDYLNVSKAKHLERYKQDNDPSHLERIKEIEAKLKELVA